MFITFPNDIAWYSLCKNLSNYFSFLEPEICKVQEINDVSGVCSFELAADQQQELNK